MTFAVRSAVVGDLIVWVHGPSGAQKLVFNHDIGLFSHICAKTPVQDFGSGIAFGPKAEALVDPAVTAAYLRIEAGHCPCTGSSCLAGGAMSWPGWILALVPEAICP
jgi:hypothetical protein